MDGILHFVHYYIAHALHFLFRHIEVQFVMYLHDHLRAQVFFFEPPMNRNHRHFDDICCRSLNRCINGVALGERTYGGIIRCYIRQVAFAAKECLCVTFLARQLFLRIYITNHTRESSEIIVYQLLGLRAAAVQLLSKAKRLDAVDDTKISCFGFTTLVFRYLVDGQTVDLSRRRRMNILPRTEGC